MTELYMSKSVEVATRDSVTKAQIKLCKMLEVAQKSDARQLAAFMTHFICTNWGPVSKRDDFSSLSEENRKYCYENQWPPLSYLKEVEAYEKAMSDLGQKGKCAIM